MLNSSLNQFLVEQTSKFISSFLCSIKDQTLTQASTLKLNETWR